MTSNKPLGSLGLATSSFTASRVAWSGSSRRKLLEGCYGTGFCMTATQAAPISYPWPKLIRVMTSVACLVRPASYPQARAPRVGHEVSGPRRRQRCLSVTGFQAWVAASTLTYPRPMES